METVRAFVTTHRHIWWSLFLPVYLAVFFAVEHIVTDDYRTTQLPIDERIPFCEYFAPLYVTWSLVLAAVGIYLLLKDGEGFRRYIWVLMLTFFTAELICLLFPNGQDLRPAALPEGLFGRVVAGIYRADTNTNVFPSVHVVGTVAAVLAVFDSPSLRRLRLPAAELGVLIIMSTLFIKQHSVLDVLGAFLLCLPLGLGVYARRLRAAMGPRPADTAASS